MRKIHWKKLIVSLILPQCVGGVGSIFVRESVMTWYQQLTKPSLTPPGWVFAPVWTTLYLLMGLSFYLVLVSTQSDVKRRIAAVFFCAHLAVNALWSILFFGLRSPFLALIDIVVLLGMITLLVRIFWSINRWAGVMLVPYLSWVAFASFLNYGIWKMN